MLIDKDYILHKPKAVIFDWDNTLVNSWSLIYEAMKLTFIKYGKTPCTLDHVKTNVHRSVRDSLPFLFPNNWEEVADFYRDAYVKVQHQLKPLSNVEKTLDLLLQQGIYMAIVSNKRSSFLNYEVKHFKWEKYFKMVLGAGDLQEDKPSPLTVYEALKHSSVKAGNKVWFIGDSVSDMEAAYNTKCVPVFFGEDDYNSERYTHCKPKLYFATHAELSKYLASSIFYQTL